MFSFLFFNVLQSRDLGQISRGELQHKHYTVRKFLTRYTILTNKLYLKPYPFLNIMSCLRISHKNFNKLLIREYKISPYLVFELIFILETSFHSNCKSCYFSGRIIRLVILLLNLFNMLQVETRLRGISEFTILLHSIWIT